MCGYSELMLSWLVFFNIMSLGFPWLGGLLKWNLLDPIGGMVLSSYIIWQWCLTLHENFTNRKQRSIDPATRQEADATDGQCRERPQTAAK
jgi:divalent metal cation (Fe/Co/Zn/Cd) transporter